MSMSMSTLSVDRPDPTFHDDALTVELSSIPVNTASPVPVNAIPPNHFLAVIDLPVIRVNTSPPKKMVNVLLICLSRDVKATFHTYSHPPSSLHASVSSKTHVGDVVAIEPSIIMTSPPQTRASLPLFSQVEEPLDDALPCGPLSLRMHHHDNGMSHNSSFEPTMDGDMVMLPPLDPSSLDQETDNPYPQDNTMLDNPFVEESGSDWIHLTQTLIRYNLFLHSQYRTIHCHNKIGSEECGTVQLPYAVPEHLQSQHQFIFNTAKEKKDLEAYIITLNPVTDAQAFVNPKPGLAPVKGLKMEKGFCCKKCSYAAPAPSSMKNHWSNDHRGGSSSYTCSRALARRLGTALLRCAYAVLFGRTLFSKTLKFWGRGSLHDFLEDRGICNREGVYPSSS